MNPLYAILAGPSGKPSSIRASMMFVVVVLTLTWSVVSVAKLDLQPISEMFATLILGSLGIHAWRRGREEPEPKTKSPQHVPPA